MNGIDVVNGAVDGCHITRKTHNEAFIHRKGFSSVVLQAVCDHQKKLPMCSQVFPDQNMMRVFANSTLKSKIDNDEFASWSFFNWRCGI